MSKAWTTEKHRLGVTLVVNHACGHEGRLFYGGEEFAKHDAPTQTAGKYVSCWNRDELAKHQKLTAPNVDADSSVTP